MGVFNLLITQNQALDIKVTFTIYTFHCKVSALGNFQTQSYILLKMRHTEVHTG